MSVTVANASLLRTGDRRVLGNDGDEAVGIETPAQLAERARAERVRGHFQYSRHLLARNGGALDGGPHRDAQIRIDLAAGGPAEHLEQSVADQGVRVAPPTSRISSICDAAT